MERDNSDRQRQRAATQSTAQSPQQLEVSFLAFAVSQNQLPHSSYFVMMRYSLDINVWKAM